MNDELLNITLTESEVNMIMDALNGAIMPTPESQDLMHDLLEQVARHDDPDWVIDTEPTEIEEGFSFSVSENDFIDAGIRAREQAKASSRAASGAWAGSADELGLRQRAVSSPCPVHRL